MKRVRVNTDFIEAYLRRNHMTQSEFSKHLGYCSGWYAIMKCQQKGFAPIRAIEKMIDFGFAYKDIVIEEGKPQAVREPTALPEITPPQMPAEPGNEDIAVLLRYINERLTTIENILKGIS